LAELDASTWLFLAVSQSVLWGASAVVEIFSGSSVAIACEEAGRRHGLIGLGCFILFHLHIYAWLLGMDVVQL
jgi:hypothetical protein